MTEEYVATGPVLPYLNTDRLRKLVDELSSREVKNIGDVFLRNIQKVKMLIAMPYNLVAQGIASIESLVAYTVCALEAKERPGNLELNRERARERLAQEFGSEKGKHEFACKIEKHVDAAMRDEDFKSVIGVIRQVTVPLVWTALEGACRDLWVFVVNRGSLATAQKVFSALDKESEGGLGRKGIEIGVLARHGFDLRGRVGSILVTKFHFSSIEGLKRAFSALGDDGGLGDVFGSSDLGILEMVRHLIVHRAGIVDEKFLRSTNWNVELGKEINLSVDQLATMLNAAIGSASQLITRIDSHYRS